MTECTPVSSVCNSVYSVVCPLSWNVHCNFPGDGKCNKRGWACTPHPHQPELILPTTLMTECTPVSSVWNSVYSVVCPLSWSVHCNFTGDGKCNERGCAVNPPPSPAWANFTPMIECTPVNSVCNSVYSVVCPLSWSVHCNFTGDGKCNERGWAFSEPPPSPAWANFTLMIECKPESSRCNSVYSVVCGQVRVKKGSRVTLQCSAAGNPTPRQAHHRGLWSTYTAERFTQQRKEREHPSMRGAYISPNSYIHVSVCNFYIPTIGLPILLAGKLVDLWWKYINRSQTHTWMWKLLGMRPRSSFFGTHKSKEEGKSFQEGGL